MKRGLFYFPNLFHSEIPKSLTSQPSFKLSRRVDGDINIDQVLQDIIYFNQSTSELNFLQPVRAVSFLCCSCHDAAQSRAAAPLLSLIVVFTFSSLGRGENNNTAPPPRKKSSSRSGVLSGLLKEFQLVHLLTHSRATRHMMPNFTAQLGRKLQQKMCWRLCPAAAEEYSICLLHLRLIYIEIVLISESENLVIIPRTILDYLGHQVELPSQSTQRIQAWRPMKT